MPGTRSFLARAAGLLMALALAACAAPGERGGSCPVPGDPIHWVVDYCMFEVESDDEIAASDCIERERDIPGRDGCAGKLHYKRRLCEGMVRLGLRPGSVGDCVQDPAFRGRTVERGGVGG